MSESLATTENLLHPRQVAELREEKAKLEGMLRAPQFIRTQLQDGGANVAKRVRDIDRVLAQAPQPIPAERLDEAVKLEADLRGRWTNGMPTHAEMRRNPAGAVDKHRAWENRSKADVLSWKHLRRRLHASGVSNHRLDTEGDVSNVEMYRPAGGSGELNMHNEQIQGKTIMMPPPGAAPAAVLSDSDEAALREIAPDVLENFALYSNEQRAEILALVRGAAAPAKAPDKVPAKRPAKKAAKGAKKARRPMSPEALERRRTQMRAMNEARRAARAQRQAGEA